MERAEDRREKMEKDSIALPSSSDLRGRQSVRATFRLSENAINTVSALAAHLRIRQKSLFDHLIQDRRSLEAVASVVEPESFERLKRIQKTFVISRKTLCCLNDASRDFNAPRDALVEYSIRRLSPMIEEERERHRRRKEILRRMTEYLEEGEDILKESRSLLGDDDPVHEKLEASVRAGRKALTAAFSLIKKGEMAEGS